MDVSFFVSFVPMYICSHISCQSVFCWKHVFFSKACLFVSLLYGKEDLIVTSCLMECHVSSMALDMLRYREWVEASEHGNFYVP